MDSIEQYFQEEYIIEKNRIKEIEDLLHEVIKTFSLHKETNDSSKVEKDSTRIIGWPYELVDQNPLVVNSFSYSTNSMIL